MPETEALRWNLVEHVKAHALKHYNDGGWDVIVECWTDADIFDKLDADGATTSVDAIEAFSDIVSIWADYQADARNSAF